jgi:hypothetical protein
MKGAAIEFGIGVAILVVILALNGAGWVNIDFNLRTNQTLYALPVVTAVCLPLLYGTLNRFLHLMTASRRRYGNAAKMQQGVDSVEAAAPDDWTDADFMPRDDPDLIEALRNHIRHRLYQGATRRQVEDELIAQGIDPTYAIEIVSSVRTTRHYDQLETGTELFVDGVSTGFFENPVYRRKLRLAERQRRREREASGDIEPNPELRFEEPKGPAEG